MEQRTECKSREPMLSRTVHLQALNGNKQFDGDGCAPGMVIGFGVAQPPSCDETCSFRFKHYDCLKVVEGDVFIARGFEGA